MAQPLCRLFVGSTQQRRCVIDTSLRQWLLCDCPADLETQFYVPQECMHLLVCQQSKAVLPLNILSATCQPGCRRIFQIQQPANYKHNGPAAEARMGGASLVALCDSLNLPRSATVSATVTLNLRINKHLELLFCCS